MSQKPHTTAQLAKDICRLYGCERASWLRSRDADSNWIPDLDWTGVIHVFEVFGHSRMNTCFVINYRKGSNWYYKTIMGEFPLQSEKDAYIAAITKIQASITIVDLDNYNKKPNKADMATPRKPSD